MEVRFREVDPFNCWIWLRYSDVLSKGEKDYIDGVFDSWYVMGRLGGFNSENMTSMIADYQKLLTDDSLRGAWGYVPAADTNAFGDTGWWELMWSSQQEADAAW